MKLKYWLVQSSHVSFSANFRQSSLLIFNAFFIDTSKFSSKLLILVLAKISFGPVTGYAAIGVPEARDSNITFPKVSVLEGKTKTSASA